MQEPCPKRTRAFLFGGTSPPNKKFFLRVLGASAVKILFWTSMERSKISHPRIDLRRIGQMYSMVAGGFGVRSYRHRFTPFRLVIRSLSR